MAGLCICVRRACVAALCGLATSIYAAQYIVRAIEAHAKSFEQLISFAAIAEILVFGITAWVIVQIFEAIDIDRDRKTIEAIKQGTKYWYGEAYKN